ncbi:hypothetical protein Val02_76070 [Virgisporangium aliadipatigenens]|uniref:Uncharacterized protein n=1 Tax=Virgisporangium aliadipatigenens TaxID=741659 RepID=A0A8J3YVT6_9ACTN|nr:hypothetical protein [Virgisporangium aliadipatigenens]GIJ50721.1 hypothetical protein Val02_76070 [Virgisporangium aliadipatigenens]
MTYGTAETVERGGRGGLARLGWTVLAAVVALNLLNALAYPGNYRWWANFILMPGAVLVGLGVVPLRLPAAARYVLVWAGAVVLTAGLLLMFERMADLWAYMIVVPCLGPAGLLLVRSGDPSMRAAVRTGGGLGLVGALLGVMFLAIESGWVEFERLHWWSFFMAAAGAVAAVNGGWLLRQRRGGYWFSVAVLLLAFGTCGIMAALQEFSR